MSMIHTLLESVAADQPYPLLFVTISVAHLYGFPSPDLDYDLRGVHVLGVRDVIGLDAPRETIGITGDHQGIELDLVTHDVKKFFTLMLKKNGYVLEQLYSPHVVRTTPEHEELERIGKAYAAHSKPRSKSASFRKSHPANRS